MAVLHSAQRKALPDQEFAVPRKRKLPMHDKAHATMAAKLLNRVPMTQAEHDEAKKRLTEKLSGWGEAGSVIELGGTVQFGSEDPVLEKDADLNALSTAISFIDDLGPMDAYDLLSDVESRITTMLLSSFDKLKGPETVNCYFSNTISEATWLLSESGKKVKIPVARMGTFVHPVYGVVNFNQRDFDEMQENFANDECGFKPYLRYGHARYPNAVDGEPAVAYLEKLEQEDDVLWGIYDPLDDKLVDEIEKGAYVNASAELKRYAVSKRDGRPIGTLLTAHALTNAPFVPGMPNNQVLSAAGATDEGSDATNSCILNMSEGETHMPHENAPNEALSDLLAQVETLSISAGEREKIRKSLARLAGTSAQPGYDSNKEAGKQSSTYAKENLSGEGAEGGEGEDLSAGSQAVDKPAGKQSGTYAKEKLSGEGGEELGHGAPLKVAGKALEQMGKEEDDEEHSDSGFGELLSTLAKVFMSRGKKANHGKMGAGNVPAKPRDERMSDAAGSAAEDGTDTQELSNHTDGGEDTMNEAQIKALIKDETASLEQKFSTELAAKDQEIQSLKTELAETKTQAQQFSTHQADAAFNARVNGLVAAGIPAAVVQKAADAARLVRGQVQNLSDGTTVDASELIFQALEATPEFGRVQYGQMGQNLSTEAGADDNQYADIVAAMLGQK